MNKPENIYYYGLGSNWAFTKLENPDEAQRFAGINYVIKHLDLGRAFGDLYPVDEKDNKIIIELNGIKCRRMRTEYKHNNYWLIPDIQDQAGVIKKPWIKGDFANSTIPDDIFIKLKKLMLELSTFGTWEAKEAEEQRLRKEEGIKKMQEENEQLKKENARLKQEVTDLKAKLEEVA
jgi:hypothetical protein